MYGSVGSILAHRPGNIPLIRQHYWFGPGPKTAKIGRTAVQPGKIILRALAGHLRWSAATLPH
jgi:hypothetical protein